MKKIDKIKIEDKLLNLKEKTQIQALELSKEIKAKNQKCRDILNETSDSKDQDASLFVGIHTMVIIMDILRKNKALNHLENNTNVLSLIDNKNYEVNKLSQLVTERLKIIEKAETNDLKDFLKNNDAYSIFKNSTFESFINKHNEKTEIKNKEYKEILNEK